MKILYITDLKPNSTEGHIIKELKKLHKVYVVPTFMSYQEAMNVAKEVDIIFCGKLPSFWKRFIKDIDKKTVCWIFDVYPFNQRTLDEPQFSCDIVISTGGVADTPIIRQAIAEDHKEKYPYERIYDVMFVGSLYGQYRATLDQFLYEKYEGNYYHIGDHNEIRGKKLNHYLGQTKIVVGDSYPIDNYWSNRVYEISGRGGFLIHPYVKGMEGEWTDKENIVYYEYGNLKDLQEKIDYYLKNEGERELIRKNAFNNCPTYQQRVKELLWLLVEKK